MTNIKALETQYLAALRSGKDAESHALLEQINDYRATIPPMPTIVPPKPDKLVLEETKQPASQLEGPLSDSPERETGQHNDNDNGPVSLALADLIGDDDIMRFLGAVDLATVADLEAFFEGKDSPTVALESIKGIGATRAAMILDAIS